MGIVLAIMGVLAVAAGVWLFVRSIARSEVASALCTAIERDNVRWVKAILVTYRHRLQKEQREAAELWLIERDNEKANR